MVLLVPAIFLFQMQKQDIIANYNSLLSQLHSLGSNIPLHSLTALLPINNAFSSTSQLTNQSTHPNQSNNSNPDTSYPWLKLDALLSSINLSLTLSSSSKISTTNDWSTALTQFLFQNTLSKISLCRNQNSWSFRQIKKQAEPQVPSHWAVVVNSAIEMSIDYRQEQKWKKATAYFFSRHIASNFLRIKENLNSIETLPSICTISMYLENIRKLDTEPVSVILHVPENIFKANVNASSVHGKPLTDLENSSTFNQEPSTVNPALIERSSNNTSIQTPSIAHPGTSD